MLYFKLSLFVKNIVDIHTPLTEQLFNVDLCYFVVEVH